MPFWLIIFIFDAKSGEFLVKDEYLFRDRIVCESALKDYPKLPKELVAKKLCVSYKHYTGEQQDPGVDWD